MFSYGKVAIFKTVPEVDIFNVTCKDFLMLLFFTLVVQRDSL